MPVHRIGDPWMSVDLPWFVLEGSLRAIRRSGFPQATWRSPITPYADHGFARQSWSRDHTDGTLGM